mmetsp:Transcript_11959/g.34270  ORF Transcript_11959/g.34270 Transcript_11959/m.34270 type:complete len:514 (+) Transcript_11959:143-1684(+)
MKHFGKHLTSTTADSSISYDKDPPSPTSSTFSKREHVKVFNREGSDDTLPFQNHYQTHLHRRQLSNHRMAESPSNSFSEDDSSAMHSAMQQRHPLHAAPTENGMLLGSTISTPSSIGLPSKYPGSSGHFREHSLENMVMEELQDFDEMFGRDSSTNHPSTSAKGIRSIHSSCDDTGSDNSSEESPSSRIRTEDEKFDDDDDDDLYTLSRDPMQARESNSRKSYFYTAKSAGSTSNADCDDDDDDGSTHDFLSRMHENCDDDDDVLCILSRPQTSTWNARTREVFQHSRTISELSSTSLSTSVYSITEGMPENARNKSAGAIADNDKDRDNNHRRSSSGASTVSRSQTRSRESVHHARNISDLSYMSLSTSAYPPEDILSENPRTARMGTVADEAKSNGTKHRRSLSTSSPIRYRRPQASPWNPNSEESFHHTRDVSELSCMSVSTPAFPPEDILPENPRTESADTDGEKRKGNGTIYRSSSPDAFSTSSKRHRRSRNHALGSSEFYDSILKQL